MKTKTLPEFAVITMGPTNSKGFPKWGSGSWTVWKKGFETLDAANQFAKTLTDRGHYGAHGRDLRDLPERCRV